MGTFYRSIYSLFYIYIIFLLFTSLTIYAHLFGCFRVCVGLSTCLLFRCNGSIKIKLSTRPNFLHFINFFIQRVTLPCPLSVFVCVHVQFRRFIWAITKKWLRLSSIKYLLSFSIVDHEFLSFMAAPFFYLRIFVVVSLRFVTILALRLGRIGVLLYTDRCQRCCTHTHMLHTETLNFSSVFLVLVK